MDRLACVNVAALPLQILLRANPSWRDVPVVVVEDDKPQAPVLYLNALAHRLGIRSGQRYATALTLARDLRAGTVSPSQIKDTLGALADLLRRYSPNVEPGTDLPSVFWLDAQGLRHLYASLRAWADTIRLALQKAGMRATVAAGFSHFGVYALALSYRGTVVCADADEERAQVLRVSLGRLHLEPDIRDRLQQLGVSTVGDFLRLPSDGIRVRFGATLDALYQLVAGRRWSPLLPVPAEALQERSVNFDAPESNVERLLFVAKRLLDGLVPALAGRAEAIASISLTMRLDNRTTRVERLRPGAGTLDVGQLLDLIYLRLRERQLPAGIVTLRLMVDACAATVEQRRLFPLQAGLQSRRDQTGQDADAVLQAFARLRAECGEHSVVRARLSDGHLPASQFRWEPLAQMPPRATPRVVAGRPLVRRIFAQHLPLPANFALENPRSLFSSAAAEGPQPEGRVFGPYVLSGGWWGSGVHRDYYFAYSDAGDLLWLFYDRRRRRFFLQGRVE